MPQITGQFRDFYGVTTLPFIRKVVGHEYQQVPVYYTKFFAVRTSTRGAEQASGLFGVGLLQKIGETQSIRPDRAIPSFNVSFVHEKFGADVPTSLEAVEDDKWGVIAFSHASLARATRTTREYQHARIFQRAFNGSYVGPDGKSLCASDHPKRYGVQSNVAAVPADLDYLSLRAALTDFLLMRDGAGNFHQVAPDFLVTAPAQYGVALEITAAGTRPDTADRAMNVLGKFPGGMPQAISWPHISASVGGDDDAWFLVAKRNGLVSYDRRAPYTKTWFDDPSETGHYAIRYRNSQGWEFEDGVWGNAGA